MPTIISHPAIALLKPYFRKVERRVVTAGAIATILPDADTAGFAVGIPYHSTFGHRGFTHSIFFALVVALAVTAALKPRRPVSTFAFLFICAMSHATLDALTNGGLGVAFFSPFSNQRYFLPWRPIAVSPIGAGFFSRRGVEVLASEAKWIWLPLLALGAVRALLRRSQRPET